MLIQLWDALSGKKTYIIGIISIIYALSAAGTGHLDWTAAKQMIEAALLGMGIRHGISTS